MYRALNNKAPVYMSGLYTAPRSSSRNNHLQFPRPRTDLFKTSIAVSSGLLWKFATTLQIIPLTQLLQGNLSEHLNRLIRQFVTDNC